jgi:LacI family transcriptional regulator
MATIHDVARKAGVAPITVSRVINNSGYVSEGLRQKVNDAIEELGYVPNVLARSLKSKRTNTIALVFTDITNPYFNILARGVEDAASELGYTVIFCNTDESQEQEDKYIQLLLQKQVDGVLLVPADVSSKSIERIRKQNTAVVIIDRRIEDAQADIVRGDSEGGAYQLTKYLIDLGHEQISLLSGPRKVSTSVDRVNGYQRAMSDHGLQANIDYYYGEYTQKSGHAITKQLFNQNGPPTAIFGGNNLVSIGALAALRQMKIKVPDEVAVVSFDDIPENLSVNPFMTVIAQPPYEIGQEATKILISRIKSGEADLEKYQEVVFPVELIVRESSGSRILKMNKK